jgi:WD40 repeat protein
MIRLWGSQVWDLDTLTCTSLLAGHKHSVYSLAWQQEAGIVFSGSKDKTIKV